MNINTIFTITLTALKCSFIAGLTMGLMLSVSGCPSKQPAFKPTVKELIPDDEIKVTIIYDNYPGPAGLTSDWGFACVIAGLEKTILFDTGGNGKIFLNNMRRLNIDPKLIDLIVISHPHSDHTNGLEAFLKLRPGLDIYIPSSFDDSLKRKIRSLGGVVIEAENSLQIFPGACTTGSLGQNAIPEHGLCIKTAHGWVLITGCAHPGIENLAEIAQNVIPEPLYMALGGFHMNAYSSDKINTVIDRLQALGITHVAPTHCTGDNARNIFSQRLGQNCTLPHLGYSFHFLK